jgi:DNA-binding transcriptional LysR family regulator
MSALDEIQVFLRVVERGSFTGAANQLGLPLTSVSRKIKSLEERLGVQLLHRTTRRVTVTEAGRAYYEQCVDAVEAIEQAEASVKALTREPEGRLRILAPYSFATLVLDSALAQFRLRYPSVRLSITLDNSMRDLIEGGFDIAVRQGPLPESSYMVRHLGGSSYVFVASPAYLERAGQPSHPRDLLAHELVAVTPDSDHVTWNIAGPEGTIELRFQPALTVNDQIFAVRYAVSGGGIALLSRGLVRKRVADGELRMILPGWRRREDLDLYALFPRRATLDLKTRAFLDFLVERVGRWFAQAEQLGAAE